MALTGRAGHDFQCFAFRFDELAFAEGDSPLGTTLTAASSEATLCQSEAMSLRFGDIRDFMIPAVSRTDLADSGVLAGE